MKQAVFLATAVAISLIPQIWTSPAIFPQVKEIANHDAQQSVLQNNATAAVEKTTPDIRLVPQLGHSRGVFSVAISSNGKYVVTVGGDRTAVLWEVESGREIRRFTGEAGWAAISPDGQYVVTTSGTDGIVLWEAESGKELKRFAAKFVKSVAVSSDWKYLLGGADRVVVLWELETGREVRRFTGHTRYVMSLAISLDGRYVVAGSDDNTARVWETQTGREVSRFTGHARGVDAVAISPDGSYVVTGSSFEKSARLWNVKTGSEVRRFITILNSIHPDFIRSIAISPDGKFVVTGSQDYIAHLWELESGREITRFEHSESVNSVAISSDGKYVLTGGMDWAARLWELQSGREIRKFQGDAATAISVSISSDSKYLVSGSGDRRVALWELDSGRQVQHFVNLASPAESVAISLHDKYVVTGGYDGTAQVLEMESGREIRSFREVSQGRTPVAISANGEYVVTGMNDGTARVYQVASGREVRRFRNYGVSLGISRDGKYVVSGGMFGEVRIWEVASARLVRRFSIGAAKYISSIAISPDAKHVVTGTDAIIEIWDAKSGRELRRFPWDMLKTDSIAVSLYGPYVITGSNDETARLSEIGSSKDLRRFEGHTSIVQSVDISSDGKFVLTASNDSTVRFWDFATGMELCRLISFTDGNWAVVTPDGRFDVSDLEEVRGLQWVTSDDPMRPLPLEVFMRDYYEPKLLARILKGEEFKPFRNLSGLNRVQPEVRIANIERQQGKPDLVTISVEVAKAARDFKSGKENVTRETDVYDVRLLRNGQIVRQFPGESDSVALPATHVTISDSQQLTQWRTRNHVDLNPDGKRLIRFENIRLPRTADLKKVEFSAYGFNEDRVKSRTDTKQFEIPLDLTSKRGRAYLITVGVNAYEEPAFDLKYSANDARSIQQTLFETLSKVGEYEQIVQVPLISDYKKVGTERIVTENLATKTIFKAVVDLLAGRPVNAETRRQIPNADQLRQASPEDFLLISFSSHGYVDSDGDFYLVLADTGKSVTDQLSDELLRKLSSGFLSSEELSLWLRDVDAGEMIMIVDACHSAAIQGKDFKPGPMGSRGLGQLSYDKGMRILTATQTGDIALGSGRLKQGLLTYSLAREGIESGKADFRPVDKSISVSEWLQYGEHRVPSLYEEIINGDVPSEIKDLVQSRAKEIWTQQPSLFDFSKKRRTVLLVGQQ